MVYSIYKVKSGIIIQYNGEFFLLKVNDWNEFINDDQLYENLKKEISTIEKIKDGNLIIENEPLPPIDKQEVWAAGVTYYKSKEARMSESKTSEGEVFYDKVYSADRPELFFKATAQKTVGSGDWVKIRKDSDWNVPEPELTLFITSNHKIVGYTVGNDMSSRSIEGENPLYLPQAKVYDRCAGLGPCITVSDKPLDGKTQITMHILRNGRTEYLESISINQMKRKHQELVDYLFKEYEFPYGCFLMTGTGIVPPNDFTLQTNDEIRITIDSIGTLINFVR